MEFNVEAVLRRQANGSEAVYRQLMKAYVARVERFLDRIDPVRTAAWLARAYNAPASPN